MALDDGQQLLTKPNPNPGTSIQDLKYSKEQKHNRGISVITGLCEKGELASSQLVVHSDDKSKREGKKLKSQDIHK